MQTREVVAMVASKTHGPLTRVENICNVRVDGGDVTDQLELLHDDSVVALHGGQQIELFLPPGIVRIRRLEGKNPVSVYIGTY